MFNMFFVEALPPINDGDLIQMEAGERFSNTS